MHWLERKFTKASRIASFLFLVIGLLAVLLIQTSFADNWHIVDTSGNVGLHTSLALDTDKNPYISFYDATNGNLKFASLDASGFWKTEKVDGDDTGPEKVGEFTSLAMDSSDKPHISYYDLISGDLKYAYSDDAGWHTEIADWEQNAGKFSSIALDSSENPCITYYYVTEGNLRYAYKDDNGWHVETVDSPGNVGEYASIVMDTSGTYDKPHISYRDVTNSNLKYAYRDSSGWHFETVDSEGDVGLYTSIALDSSGKPHISYYDVTNRNLKYASKKSGSWQIKVVDSEGDVGVCSSIALNSSGRPRISYYDVTKQDLKHAFKDANDLWQFETVDSTGNIGNYSSIELNDSGDSMVSYYDATNADLKYTVLNSPKIISTSPVNSASSVSVLKTITITFSKDIEESSDFGKIVLTKGSNQITTTNSVSGNELTIDPANDLENKTVYTVYIPAGAIQDSSGNRSTTSYTFSFTTAPEAAPEIIRTDPVRDATKVPINKNISIYFSESVVPGSSTTSGTNKVNFTLKDSSENIIKTTSTLTDDTLVIDPEANFTYSKKYTINIPAKAVKDKKGNYLASAYSFSFTTVSESEGTVPTVSGTDPANNATNVSISKNIIITFNENIYTGSEYSDIEVENPSGSSIAISKSISNKALTINPSSDLSFSTKYTVKLPAKAVEDSDDNSFASDYSFSFTTASNVITSISAPSNLRVTSTNQNIALAWNSVTGVVKYQIYRKEGTGAYTKINTTATATNQYTDTTAQLSKVYTYYVTATNSSNVESGRSNEVTTGVTIVKSDIAFRDVQTNSWFKPYLDKLLEKKAISGYSDGTFQPTKNISRAEIVKVLSVAMNWQLKKQVKPTFRDITVKAWFYQYIQRAIANGAMGGYTDGTFKPSRYITRAELAKVVASTLDLTAGTSSFSDISLSWAKSYINACAKAGIITGYKNGTYNPNGTATRAEAAAMVVRMLSFKG